MQPKHKDEQFILLHLIFDVTAAWGLIEEGRPTHDLSVPEWHRSKLASYSRESLGGNRMILGEVTIESRVEGMSAHEYALSEHVDTDVPLLVATIRLPGGEETASYIIDGYSRLHKAYWQGMPTLKAYLLTAEETDQIVHDPNRKMYKDRQAAFEFVIKRVVALIQDAGEDILSDGEMMDLDSSFLSDALDLAEHAIEEMEY